MGNSKIGFTSCWENHGYCSCHSDYYKV